MRYIFDNACQQRKSDGLLHIPRLPWRGENLTHLSTIKNLKRAILTKNYLHTFQNYYQAS